MTDHLPALLAVDAALRQPPSPERDAWLREVGSVNRFTPEEMADNVTANLTATAGEAWTHRHQCGAFVPHGQPWSTTAPTVTEPPSARFTIYRAGTHDLALTADECDQVIAASLDAGPSADCRGTDVESYNLTTPPSILEKLADGIRSADAVWWRTGAGARLFVHALERTTGDRLGLHTDNVPGEGANRRLSVTVLLSDPDDYDGGEMELVWSDTPRTPELRRGDVLVFPSHLLHGVRRLTAGTRWSLVAWAE